jgi:lysophospholipase L1-like esterase
MASSFDFMTAPRFFYWLLFLLAFLPGAGLISAQTNRDLSLWEPEIAAFEASDRANPPPKGAILFVGSSSIRKWTTLARDFPGQQVINRGFGGSQIADSTALAERIIFPYAPRLIIFYAGDNDLALGRTPEQVAADYRAFVDKVHARLPNTTIAFLSIKPCPLRWHLHDQVIEANQKIKTIPGDRLKFIDIYPLMLGANGKPKPEYFIWDGLHPSAACYRIWAQAIKPYLDF